MADQSSLVIVMARGGSKGLPLKALAKVGGKPLVARSIEHALESKLASAIVLTSDSQPILSVGRQYGVQICERPAELATDEAKCDAAVRHAVEWWESIHGTLARYIAILYGNVPLRPAHLVDRALTKLIETGADSVQSVCQVGKMHPFWMHRLSGLQNDILGPYEPNAVFRRQDLPPVFMIDGGIIALSRSSLFDFDSSGNHPHRFLGKDRRAIITQPGEVIDVDDSLDLAVAQALVSTNVQGSKAA